MNLPPFSVLISVYRGVPAAHFRESLESLARQTLQADEVVLVADGPLTEGLESTMADYAERLPGFKVVRLTENVGLGIALSKGLDCCTHELVARMDSDDIARPERFSRQVAFMATHPDIDVCSAWMEEFSTDPAHPSTVKKLPETHAELYAFGQKRNPVNHPAVIFRKAAVLACGSYLNYPLFEDYCLWARMMVSGHRFHTLQEPLLLFRASKEAYVRRSGWNYIKTELRLQFLLVGLRYISFGQFLRNASVRLAVRLMPARLRIWVYRKHLRTAV